MTAGYERHPITSGIRIEEVSRLRRFLKAASSERPAAASDGACRMVVVIDHHAAHIFRSVDGDRAADETTVEPYDPHHFHRHLVHRKEAHYQGDRVPEETSFYAEVTEALAPATELVLIGHGTGKSSAVDALLAHLEKHRPDISRRIVATEAADSSALTEPEAEALAKRHMDPLPI